MKKVILGIVALVVIAIIAGVIYVLTNLDSIVKAAIEKYGSQATQTSVKVDRVRIKLAEGDGAIYGLTIDNPKGFELRHAITLGQTGLGFDLKSARKEPYIINHITVRDPKVFFEVDGNNRVNLNELKKNLISDRSAEEKAKSTDKTSTEPRLIIRRFTFEQGKIAAKVTPLNKDYQLNLPDINIKDLGGSQGATPKEIAREVLQRLIDAAKKEIKEKGIDAELNKLKSGVKTKVEEEKARIKGEADSKIEEEKKKVEDKLRNLLN